MSYVRVPPDSTGKKVYTVESVVGSDTVQTQVVHIADSENPEFIQAIDIQGSASVRFAEGQPILAGFGSLKTSGERVLGVYESSLDSYESLFSTVTANGGELTYSPSESSEILSVTGSNGSSAKTTTNRYHYYLPGSANVFKGTFSFGDSGKTGNHRSFGPFDSNDGCFFQLYDTTLYVCIRSSVSGSVIDTKVPQSLWNVDKLDGTGKSGYNIDITKINVFWLDYQWLGAGRVRFGVFAPDGSRITCHRFENAGAFTVPYMRTGTLPLSFENVNHAATGSSSEIRAVCMAMYTEGTHEDYTFWRYADAEVNAVTCTTNTTLLSIRATPTVNGKHNSVIIYPETLNVYSDQPVAVTIWQETDVTGGTWNTLGSIAEQNTTGLVSITNAQRFKTLYFDSGAHSVCIDQYFEKNDEGIQVSSNGIPELWTFSATRLTNNTTNVTLNLGYKELW